ncbi:MAG: MgtC/SapB family protein [Gemmatimonadales bacterium]
MQLAADIQTAADLGVAALAGLAVGIERERSGHATGPAARFAGVRTFFLIGLLGGLAGWLARGGLTPVAVVLLAGGAALTIVAYRTASRGPGGVDGTTEAAALVVLALGFVAGLGQIALASGLAALVVLALGEKARIARWVEHIGEDELRAALQFSVLALVILPLLPAGPFGPLGGIRPRSLWVVVLIFTGVNFAGYLARRAVGENRGYGLTGLLGGLISSTAVTLAFSRQSRERPRLAGPLALGIVAACTMLIPRVAAVTLLLNPDVTLGLIPFLAPPLVVGAGIVALVLLRSRPGASEEVESGVRNPLELWSAIRMAIAFQAVLMVIHLVQDRFGSAGVITSAALLGLTDMDALTLSMTRLAQDAGGAHLAAQAIGVGILSNTMVKLGLTLLFGAAAIRRVASAGLLGLAAASLLGLWLGW